MSDSDSEYDRPRWTSRLSPQATRIKNGELYVHKDYEGRFLLCFSVTGLQEGGPQHLYRARALRSETLAYW